MIRREVRNHAVKPATHATIARSTNQGMRLLPEAGFACRANEPVRIPFAAGTATLAVN